MNSVLIGYGYWGKIVQSYLNMENGVKLKGIFRGREDKEEFKKIILKNNVSSVFLCTPIETHYELCKFFLENNINVFCEKPLCENLEQTIELFELANKKKCILFVDYIYRYSASIQKLKERMENISKIKFITMNIQQFGNFYKNTNVTEIIGVHMLSIIAYIFAQDDLKYDIDVLFEKTIDDNVIYRLSKIQINGISIFIEENLCSLNKMRTIEVMSENNIILFDMLSEQTLKIKTGYWEDQKFIELKQDNYIFDEKNNLANAIRSFENVVTRKKKYNFESQDIWIAKIMEQYKHLN